MDGLANGQIAVRLHLAESTVKSHLATAFAKLGVHSRKDAVALLLDPAEGLAAAALPLPAQHPLLTMVGVDTSCFLARCAGKHRRPRLRRPFR